MLNKHYKMSINNIVFQSVWCPNARSSFHPIKSIHSHISQILIDHWLRKKWSEIIKFFGDLIFEDNIEELKKNCLSFISSEHQRIERYLNFEGKDTDATWLQKNKNLSTTWTYMWGPEF